MLPVVALLALLTATLRVDPPRPNAPPYESTVVNERLGSGVHLGGIGAGKIEFLTDARFFGFTGNGNWDRPLGLLEHSFFSVEATGERNSLRALAGGDPSGVPSVESIEFDGRFPIADVAFADPSLPFDVTLRAVASFAPGDVAASSVPGALFRIELRRKPNHECSGATLHLSFDHLVGLGGNSEITLDDPTGQAAQKVVDADLRGVLFSIPTPPMPTPLSPDALLDLARINASGTFAIATDASNATSLLFNALTTDAFSTALDSTQPTLPFDTTSARGEIQLATLLSVPVTFDDDGRADVDFAIAWHAPHHVTEWDGVDHGKAYSLRFDDAMAVASALLGDADIVESRTTQLERILRDSSLDEWIVVKLLNSLGPLFAGTVLTRDGWFGCIESPVTMRGALGTMDQRLSSHAAQTFLFPTLDQTELQTFARLQVKPGAVSHFSGNSRLQLDSNLVPYGLVPWPDLSCSFVLQVDSHARWTGDRAFLEEMRPRVDLALHWVNRQDLDGDGIPEGGSTFDNRPYSGGVAYTASLYLGALRAGARVARITGDEEVAAEFDRRFEKTHDGLLRELWNGRWLDKAYDPIGGERSHDCNMAQLAGEFRASLVSLGPLLPRDVITRATRSMLEMNGTVGHLPVVDLSPGGEEAWTADCWVQYSETYFAMQAIQRRFAQAGIDQLRRIAHAQRYLDRSPYNVALVYDVHTGERRWGDQYMTTPATWFLPRVLTGFDIDRLALDATGAPRAVVTIDPSLPTTETSFRIPIFHGDATWSVGGSFGPNRSRHYSIESLPGSNPIAVDTLILGLPDGTTLSNARLWVDGEEALLDPYDVAQYPRRARFHLPTTQQFHEGDRLDVYLIDTTSAPLVVTTDAGGRPFGAPIELRDPNTVGRVEFDAATDDAWPLLLEIEASLLDSTATPVGLPLRPIEKVDEPTVGMQRFVTLLPANPLTNEDRRWLGALHADERFEAVPLLERADSLRRAVLHPRGIPSITLAPESERRALRRDFNALRTRGPRSPVVAVDLQYLGNPLTDNLTRLRITARAPNARFRIRDVALKPPAGGTIVTPPHPPAGAVFRQGEAYQTNAMVSLDADVQWRRSNFEVTIRGDELGDRPRSFKATSRVSVGYDFIRRAMVCGPFATGESAESLHSFPFGPEVDGVDRERQYERGATWRPIETVYEGILDLREIATLEGSLETAVYVAVDVHAEEDIDARLLLGSGGGVRVWMGNQQVHDHPGPRFAGPAQDRVDVRLTRGRNRFLFKVSGVSGVLALLVEVVDRNDESIAGLRTSLPGEDP